MTNRKIRPALPARIAAWGIAFLLTVTLTIAAIGGPAAYHRVLTDEELHVRIATDETTISEQIAKTAEEIREMAEEYSFSADDVISLLSREEFADINNQAAGWWTRIVSEGIMDEVPAWKANEQIISTIYNTLNRADMTDEEREETAKGIANEIEKTVNRTVIPFRKALVTLAVRYLNRKTDLAGAIRLASRIPQIAVALSLFFSGLIAFLLGKRIRYSLKYYGAAFAGAGLSTLTGILMIRYIDISGMIRASSERLDYQVQSMMKAVETETWICAAALIVLGMICLICYNHSSGRQDQQ